jgi:peptide/nickel transport system permease protein
VTRIAGSVALTFLGLLLVTFLIGRVVPIDPVLAAVGDRAPVEVYERVASASSASTSPLAAVLDLHPQGPRGDFGRSA